MKQQKIILIAICAIITGCGLLEQTPPPPPDIAFGTTALEIIPQSSTTNNMYMCQEGIITSKLVNSGTATIKDGTQSIILEDQVLQLIEGQKQKPINLEGKTKFRPEGDATMMTIKVKSKMLPEQLETYTTQLVTQYCYPYETKATVPVCIDPDIQNNNPTKPCKAETVTFSGQGAPVAVTKIEQIMVPKGTEITPTFFIYLRNLGNGRVITSDDAKTFCTQKLTGRAASKIQATVKLHETTLSCSSQTIQLEANEDTRIVCRAIESSITQGTFTSLLTIELQYGYVNTQTYPITITKLPGQTACQ